jgi:hypothetical protein
MKNKPPTPIPGTEFKQFEAVDPNTGEMLRYHCFATVENVPNGYGAMLLPDGTLFEGVWTNGHLDETGQFLCPNGDWYIGQMK